MLGDRTVKNRKDKNNIIIHVLLIALCVSIIFPFLWMVSASLKNLNEVYIYPIKWIPQKVMWSNYSTVIINGFAMFFFNSIKVTSMVVLIMVFLNSLAGYSFAKLRFPFRDKLFIIYIASMMIPLQILMIPQFVIIKSLELFNTHAALIMLQGFGGSAFCVFLMRQYFITIHNDIIESARIDGASELRIFSTIALPLAKPALTALMVLIIMSSWNDMVTPLIYIVDKKLFTIPIGLLTLNDEHGQNTQYIMAGSCLALIPVFVAYIFAQKHFIEGITMGAVKG